MTTTLSLPRTVLSRKLLEISRFTDTKSAIPILNYLRLTLGDGRLEITGTDLSHRATAFVDADTEDESIGPQSICVNAAEIKKIVRGMKGKEVSLTITDNGELKITDGCMVAAALHTRPVEDFPPSQYYHSAQTTRLTIPTSRLFDILSRTLHAAGHPRGPEGQKFLCLEIIDSDTFRAVATDGHRISCVSARAHIDPTTREGHKHLLPTNTLRAIRKLKPADMSEFAELTMVKGGVSVIHIGKCYSVSINEAIDDRLSVDVQPFRPPSLPHYVEVEAQPVIDLAKIVAKERHGPAVPNVVTLEVSDRITAASMFGNLSTVIDIDNGEGEDFTRHINAVYLYEALEACGSRYVRIGVDAAEQEGDEKSCCVWSLVVEPCEDERGDVFDPWQIVLPARGP